MMRLMNLTTMLLSCLLGLGFLLSTKDVYAEPNPELHSLIVYSQADNESSNQVYLLDQLISHYTNSTIVSDEDVDDLADYDFVFYVGLEAKTLAPSFIQSIDKYNGSVFFIGENINQFQKRLGLTDTNKTMNIKELVAEKNRTTLASFKEIKRITGYSKMKVILSGKRGNDNFPILVRNKKDYYLASTQLDDEIIYYLAKELGSIFQMDSTTYHSSFVKIEEVNPDTNVEALTKITTYLSSRDIPLILAVSPVGQAENTVHLADSRELVRKLLSLQSLGGSIVYSYPIFTDTVSVEDKKAVIEAELSELASYQIYPVAASFTANSTSIKQEDIELVSDYFSILLAAGETLPLEKLQQTAPYINQPFHLNGLIWIPETINRLHNTEQSLLSLKGDLNKLTIAPNSTLGMTVYPYTDLNSIRQGVNQLQNVKGTTWLQINDWPISVHTPFLTIESNENKELTIVNNLRFIDSFIHRFQLSKTEIILWGVAAVVTLFIVAFAVYTIYLKLKLRKALFAERRNNG